MAANTDYLRALTLTVLSFAAGVVVAGMAQVLAVLLAVNATSDGPSTAMSVVGALAGAGIAIGGLIVAIGHYQAGVSSQVTAEDSIRSAESSHSPPSGAAGAPLSYAEIRERRGAARRPKPPTARSEPRDIWSDGDEAGPNG